MMATGGGFLEAGWVFLGAVVYISRMMEQREAKPRRFQVNNKNKTITRTVRQLQ